MMAVPRYRISTTHPAVVANNRELRRHLGKRKVFCERHVGAPQVGRHHHHAWAEPGGEEDAREAAGQETHTEGGGEGSRLGKAFVLVLSISHKQPNRGGLDGFVIIWQQPAGE